MTSPIAVVPNRASNDDHTPSCLRPRARHPFTLILHLQRLAQTRQQTSSSSGLMPAVNHIHSFSSMRNYQTSLYPSFANTFAGRETGPTTAALAQQFSGPASRAFGPSKTSDCPSGVLILPRILLIASRESLVSSLLHVPASESQHGIMSGGGPRMYKIVFSHRCDSNYPQLSISRRKHSQLHRLTGLRHSAPSCIGLLHTPWCINL